MMRRHNRLLVLLYIVSDAMLGMVAFGLAYAVRFYSGLIPISKGVPPFAWYLTLLPWVGALVPIAFHVQGLYRLRRGRSRVDDFFAVLPAFALRTWLRQRRIRRRCAAGQCVACGYDLRGTPAGACPECGRAAAAS